jgi:hypothetical protein
MECRFEADAASSSRPMRPSSRIPSRVAAICSVRRPSAGRRRTSETRRKRSSKKFQPRLPGARSARCDNRKHSLTPFSQSCGALRVGGVPKK